MNTEPWQQDRLIQIERQAQELRAEYLAEMVRALGQWLRARLGRAPTGRTA